MGERDLCVLKDFALIGVLLSWLRCEACVIGILSWVG